MSQLRLGGIVVLLVATTALLGITWASRADDPYWAAERFLRSRGLEVIRSQDLRPLNQLPATEVSLMLLGEREQMSATQAQTLLAWVYAGGRLLVAAQGYWAPGGASDPLLDPLNIRLLNAYASAGGRLTAARSTLTELYLETDTAPLLMGFAPGRHLEDADDLAQSWANSPQGTHMLQLNMGAGTLTVVSDTGLWRNRAVGQFDNAWLLWYLNQGRQVVMQYREPAPATLQQLAAYPATLASTLVVLSLLAWWGATHWPQRRPKPAPALGTPAEGYRRAGREQLLRGLREDIQRCARRRHPGFGQLPVAGQWQLLAKLAATSTSTIAQALRPHPGEHLSAAAFRQQVAQLQAIRNAL
ncbi:DUF4350 domain-containing protein [Pseudomonas sp. RIT-PI-S]|uniref:DUF4350 domain-containing protein n=1 Tax=Pseudomonas sp. RIT-PI-S TaxID=3035295 RepID=UPI0021D94FCA|nr:DUF4350 domain-containing protein [Pseudomonas sp. RIT-PI-S]